MMMSVRGVLRKIVTYAVPTPRATGIGDTRIAARMVPSIRAPTAENAVSCTVVQNASIS